MGQVPLVSVIIPTHRVGHCRQAIKCAFSQTYSKLQIIVSDNSDGSDIHDYVSQQKGILYLKNINKETITSAVTNISNGLRYAQGDYIKFLFDDDLIFPHTIETMIRELLKYDSQNIGVVTSHRQVIDCDNLVIASKRLLDYRETTVLPGREVVKYILKNVSNIIGEFSTVMFNRKHLPYGDPMAIYDYHGASYHPGLIDVPLYLNVLETSNLLILPYELSAFRRHEQSGSNMNTNPYFHHAVTDWLRLISGGFKKGILSRDELLHALKSYDQLQLIFSDRYPLELKNFTPLFDQLLAETKL